MSSRAYGQRTTFDEYQPIQAVLSMQMLGDVITTVNQSQRNIHATTQMSEVNQQFENGDTYVGSKVGNKVNGYGVYSFARMGLQYRGQFVNGQPHGEGRLFKLSKKEPKPEEVYFGQWRDGKRHGKGKYTYGKAGVYEGLWQMNRKHGLGEFTGPEGHYSGQWRNDLKDGRGILQLKNGFFIQGNWEKDDLIDGKITYPNGDVYEGPLLNLQKHGTGVYTYKNKSQYRGQWNHDQKHGRGQFSTPDGDFYRGIMHKDTMNDEQGKYRWRTGFEMDCAFKNNKPLYGIVNGPNIKQFRFNNPSQ